MHKFLFVWINAKAISINNAVQLISDAHLFRISILILLSLSFFTNVSLILSHSNFFLIVAVLFSFPDDFFHSPKIFFIRRSFFIPQSLFYLPRFSYSPKFCFSFCLNITTVIIFCWLDYFVVILIRCIRQCLIQTLPDSNSARFMRLNRAEFTQL